MSSPGHTTASDSAPAPRTGLLRLAGFAWILSGVVYFLGQVMAIARWQGGTYSLSLNLISDLGMTTCGPAEDVFLPRYVCSPGHDWFNAATMVSGGLLVAGSLLLLAALRDVSRRPRGTTATAWLVLLSGIGLTGVGAVPADTQPVVHSVAALAQAVVMWVAMGWVWWRYRSWRRADRGGVPPLVAGPAAPATLVLLVISVAACVALFIPATTTSPGLMERLSFDLLNLWTILLGASVLTLPKTRTRADRRASEARRRHREKEERDAAVRRAVVDLDPR